jgi:GWxTD domain-containing protein
VGRGRVKLRRAARGESRPALGLCYLRRVRPSVKGIVLLGAASLFLGASPGCPAAAAGDEGPLFALSSPRFAADLATSLDTTGAATLQVAIQVAYTECQFVRVGAGLGAALEFLVVVSDGGRQVAGDAWEERFVVATFDETKEGTLRVATARSFRVRPGKYKVKVQVRDSNSGLTSEAERPLEIVGLGKDALGLGDLVFGECVADSAAGGFAFVRNAARRFGGDLHRFCVRSTILDLRPGGAEHGYRVAFRVTDEDGADVASGDTSLAAGAREFTLRPSLAGLFLGSYTLTLTVEEGGRKWRAAGTFEIETVTVPTGRQWATLVEILEYVAEPGEMEPLRKAEAPEERERLWREFWARRDPSPDTPRNEALVEFMQRVRFANAQFAGLGPGWRTDQGRIYIRYGPPDQVEDITATQGSPPLQIWQYVNQNLRFIFADRDGFGRYYLVNESGR